MKQALTSLLLFTTFIANAQIQFWNTADVENEQWEPFYKIQKLKQVTVYQIDEHSKRPYDTGPNSVRAYDKNTKLISVLRYKYNWSNLKQELLQADSFFYNDKGQLTGFRSCEGQYRKKTYEMEFFYNAKGQQTKQDKYTFENYQRVKEGTDRLFYTTGNNPVKLASKNTAAVLDHTRQFNYDKEGKLIRAVFTDDGSSSTEFTWNEKNELTRYKEMNSKGISKGVCSIKCVNLK